MAIERVFGDVILAAHLAKKTRMHNLGCDRECASRNPACRRANDEPAAENFSGPFTIQIHRQKKPHFNCGLQLQGASTPHQHSGNADILGHSLMPPSLSLHPIPDGGPYFIAPGSADLCLGLAPGPLRVHPFLLNCAQQPNLSSQLASSRLGHFPGDSNSPTVLSSYDCIVLVPWDHCVLLWCAFRGSFAPYGHSILAR
jgi:hypothetical protein